MSDLAWFDWECLYHVDDFIYCLSRVWVFLLAMYLSIAITFGLLIALVIYLRRRQRKKYQEHANGIMEEYQGGRGGVQ